MFSNLRRYLNRFTALSLVLMLVAGLIIQRLYVLQITGGEKAKSKADSSSVRDLKEPAPRGEILDMNGKTLASSVASYDLMFNETEESADKFFPVMAEILSLLEATGETFNDRFALKLSGDNKFYFDFRSDNPEVIRIRELRWKKDRGMDDYLVRGEFGKSIGKKTLQELTDEEKAKLDEVLLSVTPESTFAYLFRHYDMTDIMSLSRDDENTLLSKPDAEMMGEVLSVYSPDLLRKFMVVKDDSAMKMYQTDKSVKIASNISRESAFIFMQKSNTLPGLSVQLNPVRIYPYGSLASHVLGYISPINEFEAEGFEAKGYDVSSDLVGTYGLESAFENELKGNKTISTVKVDRQGRIIQELFRLEGYPGNTIKTTIDRDLQYTAEKALESVRTDLQTVNSDHGQGRSSKNATRGAVVVIDIKTGKILALASSPDFDPNVFVLPGKLTDELYTEYFNPDYEKFASELIQRLGIMGKTSDDLFPKDSNGQRYDYYDLYPKPFFNYATQGLSPVGSIFKPFTAIAGLEEGVIDKNTIIQDRGVFEKEELGDYKAENNDQAVFGDIGLTYALMVSSNYFFLETGWRLYQKLGPDALADWSWKLGMGHNPEEGVHSTTGIEIDENVYGNVFSFESRKRYLADYSYYFVNEIVSGGSARNGESFKPLEISVKDSDSEKIKKIKEELKTNLSSFFLSLEKNNIDPSALYGQLTQIIDTSLSAVISDMPEDVRKNYETSSYYSSEAAQILVYDRISEMMTPVNVLNSAIGQGDSELTILQIANACATLINGGTRYKTTLLESITDPDGNTVRKSPPEVLEKIDLNPDNVKTVMEGMYKVNNSPEGAGYKYFHDPDNEFPIETGGKTGTAEYRSYQNNGDYVGRHQYGTYISFAPYENPEIAVASIVYDSVHGSYIIDISKAIYEEYFEEKLKKDYPEYKRVYDFMPRPVMKVEPSLLRLNTMDPLYTAPLNENYVPGMKLPPSYAPEHTGIKEDETENNGNGENGENGGNDENTGQ